MLGDSTALRAIAPLVSARRLVVLLRDLCRLLKTESMYSKALAGESISEPSIVARVLAPFSDDSTLSLPPVRLFMRSYRSDDTTPRAYTSARSEASSPDSAGVSSPATALRKRVIPEVWTELSRFTKGTNDASMLSRITRADAESRSTGISNSAVSSGYRHGWFCS